jgi:hypothetical protein
MTSSERSMLDIEPIEYRLFGAAGGPTSPGFGCGVAAESTGSVGSSARSVGSSPRSVGSSDDPSAGRVDGSAGLPGDVMAPSSPGAGHTSKPAVGPG